MMRKFTWLLAFIAFTFFQSLTANKVHVALFVPENLEKTLEHPFIIEIKIPPKSHIYGEGDKDSPTKIHFSLPNSLKVKSLDWPKVKNFKERSISFSGYEGVIYLHGFFKSEQPILLNTVLKKIQAHMVYTVCDTLCIPEKIMVKPHVLNTQQWQALPKIAEQANFFSKLFLMLGFAILGGILLNLMPCVLPILSLKILHLTKSNHPKSLKVSGASFMLGTMVSFWGLASLLYFVRAAGHHVGWGFQLQSPSLVIGLIFIFFLFALNLFGVFEIGISLTRFSGRIDNSVKPFASFMHGMLACIVSTPCSAPFMGAAVGFALTQNFMYGLMIFSGLAFGVALPYLLLCWYPKSIKVLPKPGAWMETFKTILGFAMAISMVWLMHVLSAQVPLENFLDVIESLILIAIAAWLYGRYGALHRTQFVRVTASVVSLIIFLIASVHSLQPLNAMQEVVWMKFEPATVEKKRLKNPVFIDFTAKWCITCQANKKLVLNTKAAQDLFKKKNVALFQADWTNHDPAITKALEKYGRNSVPAYIILYPNGIHKVLPELLTLEIIEGALNNSSH